jgi:putative transposase
VWPRSNRTLKEQAIHGRTYRNVEAVRAAVTEFKERYNRHWCLGELGFISPLEGGQAYAMREAACAAKPCPNNPRRWGMLLP